jgi:hypothetical protein
MGGRYGHGKASCNGEVGDQSNDCTCHTEHEYRGIIQEQVEGDDLGADGVRDARADEHGTGEFHDRGNAHGLLERQGAQGDEVANEFATSLAPA